MDVLGLTLILAVLLVWFFGIWNSHNERSKHPPRTQFRGQQFTAPSPYDAPTAPIDAQTLRRWWAMKQDNGTKMPIGRWRVTK